MWNQYQTLKNQNKAKLNSLAETNRSYIDKTIRYACTSGIGMLEGELIKRDLAGMALEAETLGESLEQRLGDAAAFSRSLVSENAGTDHTIRKTEQIYYGLWQVGAILSLMTVLFIVPLGMYKAPVSITFILFNILYAIGAYLVVCHLDRFIFSSRRYKFVGIFCGFILLPILFRNMINTALSFGPSLPGSVLWILLFLSVLLYVTGRLLFEKYAVKNARENHWDISSAK